MTTNNEIARGIDDVSAAIGEIRAYIHENRHTSANLSQKFDALEHVFGRRLEGVETRITASIDKLRHDSATETARVEGRLSARIDALESERLKREGAVGVVGAILKSPTLGWVIAALGAALTWLYSHPTPILRTEDTRIEQTTTRGTAQ